MSAKLCIVYFDYSALAEMLHLLNSNQFRYRGFYHGFGKNHRLEQFVSCHFISRFKIVVSSWIMTWNLSVKCSSITGIRLVRVFSSFSASFRSIGRHKNMVMHTVRQKTKTKI